MEELPGWPDEIGEVRAFDDLPGGRSSTSGSSRTSAGCRLGGRGRSRARAEPAPVAIGEPAREGAVVGGGGREHALCWRLAQDPTVTRVLAAPGNPGMAANAECVPGVAADDLTAIVNLVDERGIDLTVVGPEAPLVAGVADRLRARGHAVFGPSAAAARIEGSKAFAKDVMARRGVPTARAGVFDDVEKAIAFVDELGGSAVVKADGLAAGKGVTVASDRETAVGAVEAALLGEPSATRDRRS